MTHPAADQTRDSATGCQRLAQQLQVDARVTGELAS